MSRFENEEYIADHVDILFNRFYNLALNRFTWKNLPEGLTSRKMEEMLVENGKVFFYRNDEGVLVCLPCFGTGYYNIYNEPLSYNVIGNKYNDVVDTEKGVVIRNNARETNDRDDIMLFAERINEVELTMDLNLDGQKTPYIILCDEKERLTFKNIIKQVRKYKRAIFGTKNLSINNITTLDTKSEYLLDKLQMHKKELMNELLTFLGINNNDVQKRERVVVDEVNANNEFILVNIDHMYDERKRAVDEINEKFGLNIIIEKREVNAIGSIHDDFETDNRP